MSVVALPFNKGVIHQESRALQVLGLWRVARERSSVNSTKQITRSWAANCGFRHNERDRSICVKGASRQRPDGSFRRNTNNQTNNSGMDSPILKSSVSVAVRPHADVELLGCRIV